MNEQRVLIVAHRLESGGVANAVNNFFLACSQYKPNIKFDIICFMDYTEQVKDFYENYGARIFQVKSPRMQGMHSYQKNIRSIIQENGPYIAVHIHTAYFIWIVAKIAKEENIPVRVGHAHGRKGSLPWFVKFWFEPIARILNRKYCTHKLSCAELSGKYTFGQDFSFFPNIAIDTRLKNQGDLSIEFPKDKLKLAYIGAIRYKQKNAGFIPKIVRATKDKNTILYVAGQETPDVTKINKELSVDGNKEKVVYLGYVDNVQKLLKNIDIVVMPSYNEGMSLTLLEAQMAGVPCVVSKGVPKTNDLQMGLFFQVLTWKENDWHEAIVKADMKKENVLTEKERFSKLKEIKYDNESIAQRLINIYTQQENRQNNDFSNNSRI